MLMTTEENIKQLVLTYKKNTSLYDIALDIGISESSLYKFMKGNKLSDKTLNKINNWFMQEISSKQNHFYDLIYFINKQDGVNLKDKLDGLLKEYKRLGFIEDDWVKLNDWVELND